MRAKISIIALSVATAFALSACGQKEEPKLPRQHPPLNQKLSSSLGTLRR